MRALPKVRFRERGFSLVETLAALLVFAIITLGLIPLLAASIRGSDVSRKGTVGKNLVIEAMERVRGLPYYISYTSQPRKVDVLDMYFPGRTPVFAAGACTGYLNAGSVTCSATNYQATGPSYVTTCPAATNPACPLNIPSGYTITYEAAFVNAVATSPETYTKQAPSLTYAYNSPTSDQQQTLLLEMIVTGRWTATGRGARTYQVRSLLSDRKFSGLKLLGDAAVDYGVQLVTGYEPQGTVNETEVTATGGHAVSHIESRRVASASQTVRAGEILLLDLVLAGDAVVGNENLDGTPRLGVEETVVAPPDSSINPAGVSDPADVNHPVNAYDFIASLSDTDSDAMSAAIPVGLPAASGDFAFDADDDDDDDDDGGVLRIANKRADTGGNPLNLDDPEDWIARVFPGADGSIEGSSSATTSALGTQPGVASTATVSFKELHLLKTDFIEDRDDRFDGAVVAVTGPVSGGNPSGFFTATATCNADNDSTANTTAASATYSGALWYWRDPAQNNSASDGRYVSVPLGPGSDVLSPLQTGAPILVYDTNPDNKDLYLFPRGGNDGYLAAWSNSAASTSVTQSGRVTSARIDTAFSIETQPVEGSSAPDTAVSVAGGSVNCRAEDYR